VKKAFKGNLAQKWNLGYGKVFTLIKKVLTKKFLEKI
jgi:hypothetical protein